MKKANESALYQYVNCEHRSKKTRNDIAVGRVHALVPVVGDIQHDERKKEKKQRNGIAKAHSYL
jgi:hypothetical protein